MLFFYLNLFQRKMHYRLRMMYSDIKDKEAQVLTFEFDARCIHMEDREPICRRISGNRWNTVRRIIFRWRPTAEGPR